MSRIDTRTATTKEQLLALRNRIIKILQRLLLRCPQCLTINRASKWTFLQGKYWYTPSSWQSGGFWLDHEWHSCHVVCPNCNREIYIYSNRQLLLLVNHIKERGLNPKDVFKEVALGDIEGNARVIQAVQSGRLKVEL